MIQPGKVGCGLLLCLLVNSLPVAALATNFEYQYEAELPPGNIEEVSNLQAQAALAREKGIPLLIEFSSPWCDYCETLEREVLEPLLRNHEYRNRVMIRKLEVSDYTRVIDFNGQKQPSVEWAISNKINLYPTLVFYNGNGEEVGQRLKGIRVFEYIFDEIDKALARAERDI